MKKRVREMHVFDSMQPIGSLNISAFAVALFCSHASLNDMDMF